MTLTSFESADRVWERIESLSLNCSQKKAAVSYVTSDSILKFSNLDILVLDASDDAISQGQTSARVIQRAMNRGAFIYSIADLHSKVMLFDQTLVVGSANISVRSSRTLVEAALVSSDQSAVEHASTWIDELAAAGQAIDQDILTRLIAIEDERPPIKRTYHDLADTHIVFFKQVMAGDIEKYMTRSSTSGTGGGARDLRVSPASLFRPLLAQMLSERRGDPRFTHGRVLSRVGRNILTTDVELWRPTAARRNELRISRFYEVPGWELAEDQFREYQNRGEMLFYVLEMDIHGTVTAKVLSCSHLTRRNPTIRAHVGDLQQRVNARTSIIGAVDVIRNVTVP
jgi:hypothetical protein